MSLRIHITFISSFIRSQLIPILVLWTFTFYLLHPNHTLLFINHYRQNIKGVLQFYYRAQWKENNIIAK